MTNDRLFITESDTDICEGYLRHMKRCGTFPKRSSMLTVAFGQKGRRRICNAIGYMKPIREADSLEHLPETVEGRYNLVAIYYAVEHLDEDEISQMIQYVRGLLIPGGSVMVVVDLQGGEDVLASLKDECREQGLREVQTDLWRSEPLNTWDRLSDAGKCLSPLAQRIPWLGRYMARTASTLWVV